MKLKIKQQLYCIYAFCVKFGFCVFFCGSERTARVIGISIISYWNVWKNSSLMLFYVWTFKLESDFNQHKMFLVPKVQSYSQTVVTVHFHTQNHKCAFFRGFFLFILCQLFMIRFWTFLVYFVLFFFLFFALLFSLALSLLVNVSKHIRKNTRRYLIWCLCQFNTIHFLEFTDLMCDIGTSSTIVWQDKVKRKGKKKS